MATIPITGAISIPEDAVTESFARARGPGGQSVNTTDSAVMLRLDSSCLPDAVRTRLAEIAGSRMTLDGILVLRSEGSRSQLLNRQEVRERLIGMIREACVVPKRRRPTRPSRAAKAKRVDGKVARSTIKAGRRKPEL